MASPSANADLFNLESNNSRQETPASLHQGGPRSQTPDAKGLMWQLPDLGLPPGRSCFDEAHFEREYAAFEEAYYSSEIPYEAIAPLNGFMANGSIRLSDKIEISNLREEDLYPDGRKRSEGFNDPWKENLCAVRMRYSLPKAVGDDYKITPEGWEKDRAIQTKINEKIEQLLR